MDHHLPRPTTVTIFGIENEYKYEIINNNINNKILFIEKKIYLK